MTPRGTAPRRPGRLALGVVAVVTLVAVAGAAGLAAYRDPALQSAALRLLTLCGGLAP